MKKEFILIWIFIPYLSSYSQGDSSITKTPFEGFDLTWLNGANRQSDFPLIFKNNKTEETLLTGGVYIDSYFNYDFHHPVDNTHTHSATIGRSNEFTMNLASIGLETNYKNAIGRIAFQFGQMTSIVQDLDATTQRGRNTAIQNLKYIREAAAGYHFNKGFGINVEMGIFMSFIGLESYITQENWNYQKAMVSEFTPFYFSGARVQFFPSQKYRTELWLVNGWQSYNSWNKTIGIGSSNCFRPTENLQLIGNFYLGNDNRGATLRFHHDNSAVGRYFNRPENKGVSQGAISLNTHYGFQSGGGVNLNEQYMAGFALSHRLWFHKNKIALSLRGDYLTNPGIYLAFSPSPVSPNDFTDALAADSKKKLSMSQVTATVDLMPSDYVTFRLEYRFRKSDKPYFAGPGGTTSPDGWINTSTLNWRPDLKREEQSLTLALNFRL